MKTLDLLARRQLVVVTGKGGVGKTTIAAGIGRLLAQRGRRTLVLEIDPRESLHQLFGGEPSGGAIVKVGPRLSYQNLQPRRVVEDLVHRKIPLKLVARRVIAHPVFRHFVDGAPGLKEMAVLGYAEQSVSGVYRHRPDVVVLDAPATGHGASMLAAPLLLSDAIAGGQLGDLAGDLAEFIGDPERVGVMLAALAEEMPVAETLELIALLERRLGRPPEGVVVNALYPPFPEGQLRGSDPIPGELLTLWRERREVNRQELARLRRGWRGVTTEVPLFPLERGPKLLGAVVERLQQVLA
jgi:hypothetical protein